MEKIFNHLEMEIVAGPTIVRAPAVLITDIAGYVALTRLIDARQRRSATRAKLWSSHVVHYIPGVGDGFPTPDIGVLSTVYCVFLFEYSAKETPLQSFRKLFK
jgi:hypothetical protein